MALAHKAKDRFTNSNYTEWATKHTTIVLQIDFTHSRLEGHVLSEFESLTDAATTEIILDTSFLHVADVLLDSRPCSWKLGVRVEPNGSPLIVSLKEGLALGKSVSLKITIATTPQCTGLQWLTAAQTPNKKYPYLFSQCEAIHARSIFPCQDTPSVKTFFDFALRSPLPVVASGVPTGATDYFPAEDGRRGTLLYTFKQEVPVCNYLFGIASGDLASAVIGPRSSVFTGSDELLACKAELEDEIEKMIVTCESIVLPYPWPLYHLVVLPAAFPLGGMENPIFNFITPALISGDKENLDVIAHEFAHTYSGNLVTCSSWEHFWLNEGWTVYIERRIKEELQGREDRDLAELIGWGELTESISRFGGEDAHFTKLVVDFQGKTPDEVLSITQYEKGYTFLCYIEGLVGREKWTPFITHYFSIWYQKSLDTEDFKKTLLDFYKNDIEAKKLLEKIDWDMWCHAPGFPPRPALISARYDACCALADQWSSIITPGDTTPIFVPSTSDINCWSITQQIVFLDRLESLALPLRSEHSRLMREIYRFHETRNQELMYRFSKLLLRARDEEVYDLAVKFLGETGRMKFVRPIFLVMMQIDQQWASLTLDKYRNFYHPTCIKLVESLLAGGI